MIKINYKGFVVECDSMEESVKFMELATKPKSNFFGDVHDPIKRSSKRNIAKRRLHMKNNWIEAELEQMTKLLREGADKNHISKDSSLRQRHNQSGIRQVAQMFMTGNSTRPGTLVDQYVKNYRPILTNRDY